MKYNTLLLLGFATICYFQYGFLKSSDLHVSKNYRLFKATSTTFSEMIGNRSPVVRKKLTPFVELRPFIKGESVVIEGLSGESATGSRLKSRLMLYSLVKDVKFAPIDDETTINNMCVNVDCLELPFFPEGYEFVVQGGINRNGAIRIRKNAQKYVIYRNRENA